MIIFLQTIAILAGIGIPIYIMAKLSQWSFFNSYESYETSIKLTLKQVVDFYKVDTKKWQGSDECLKYKDHKGHTYFIKLGFFDYLKYRRLLKTYKRLKKENKQDVAMTHMLESVQRDIDEIRERSDREIREQILKTKSFLERELKNDNHGQSAGTLSGSPFSL